MFQSFSRRRLLQRPDSPFVRHYMAQSAYIAQYLRLTVGIDAKRVNRLYYGVDVDTGMHLFRRLPADVCFHGAVAHRRAVHRFSFNSMADSYSGLYYRPLTERTEG